AAPEPTSRPRCPPPVGVTANHHVCGLRDAERPRTLPSPRATFITLVCEEAARWGSQAVSKGSGAIWNLEAGPSAAGPPQLSEQGDDRVASRSPRGVDR